jgi:hypothetical protein
MTPDINTIKRVNHGVAYLFVFGFISLFVPNSHSETNEVIGSYSNWPTDWIPLNGLNDPNDGLAKTHLDFVGNTTNACGFYASTNGYVFFRQRVQANTTNQTTFGNAHFVLINLIGTNYNAGLGEDGYPDYAFGWDNYNNTDIAKHGLEMQVRNTVGSSWSTSNLADIDGDAARKAINDINGDGRTTDGYVRVISEQNTTNFNFTTVIDYAVKWSYLQTYTGLNSNQSWKVAFASLDSSNDHGDIKNGDIAGGASPSSPLTNGWTEIYSTPTGSEFSHQGTFFSFAMISVDEHRMHLAQNNKKAFCSPNNPAKRKEDRRVGRRYIL